MSIQIREISALSDDRTTDMEKWSSFDNLPKDIVIKIMFRLPPESLMRLKSLNKSWNFLIQCLIDDPNFVAKHQRHAEQHPEMLLVHETPLGKEESVLSQTIISSIFISWLVKNGCDGNIRRATKNISVHDLPSPLIRQRRIRTTRAEVYHCNGVFCLTGDFRTLTLCCPLTSKIETFHPNSDTGVCNHDIIGMGFGSNSGGSDFKVVRILGSMRAQIFAPRSSDSWREVKISDRRIPYQLVYQHVYTKGHCFWVAIDLFIRVLCFDVLNEAFSEIYLPDGLSLSGNVFKLATLDDSVCLFSCAYSKSIGVWAMDIGDFCWRKLLRIEPCEGFRSPLAFSGMDELLMETENGDLISYNVRTQKRKSVSPKGILGSVLYSGVYVKSLASATRKIIV